MEGEDHLGFLPGLEPEGEQPRLDRDRGKGQEIIAGEGGFGRVEIVGGEQQEEEQPAEQAGPGLLEAEQQELVDPARPAAGDRRLLERKPNALEARVAGKGGQGLVVLAVFGRHRYTGAPAERDGERLIRRRKPVE